MYAIIGSHFVPHEGKFLLIALVIVRPDNIKCVSASNTPKCPLKRCVRRSKSCCQTLKHFDNVFATGGNNIVEVFESLTTRF